MSDISGWSCDERDRKNCRNGHGCHCREITSLMARNDDKAAEIERLRKDVARIKIQRDNALIDMERFANLAGVIPGGNA